MKKIGILTLTYTNNYGNSLQNYAILENLKKLGYKGETIRNNSHSFNSNSLSYRLKNIIKNRFKIKLTETDKKRYVFEKWNKKNIKFSNYIILENSKLDVLNKKYDCFLCGSDQIWNPSFNACSNIYFAYFADENKRVAISASFGIDEIPIEIKKEYTDWIEKIKYISVREKQAQQIIKELCKKESELLCDPVFTIDKSEWINMSEAPKWYKGQKYNLAYFLGEIDKDDKKMIEKTSTENECEIVYIGKYTNIETINPSEFVWLICNAQHIYTDSFHATSFSIIFNKIFTVFDRVSDNSENESKSMNSRMTTVFEMFNIKAEQQSNSNIYNIIEFDRDKRIEVIEKEKNKFIEFLKKSIERSDK